tara:strand:- start:5829 stop:7661 length:1833 start_codon:yes stop_codon:yes gene_type:complete
MASPVIQFKRGAFASLPALKAGEPAFTNDKYDLYIGLDNNSSNNKFFGSHRYWLKETTTAGSGLNLVEGTNNGTHSITVQSPASLAADYSITFPNAQGANTTILQNNGSGVLSWTASPTFTGALTISDTTDSTDKDTGAIICEGGVGIEKSVHVGAALSVTDRLFVGGQSEFIGVATFRGGTVRLGDSASDDIYVGGEFKSNLVPDDDDTYDLGTSTQEWRNLYIDGVAHLDQISGVTHITHPHSATATTITVTVATKTAAHRYNGSGSGSGYFLDDVESPFIKLVPGQTYKFDQAAGSNSGHPLRFYLDSGKTHAYTTNVTTNGTPGSAGAYTQIVVTDTTPDVLHYQCSAHGLMGNSVTTDSNAIDTPHDAAFKGSVDLGDATSDTITATGRFDSDLVPSTDGARDLGASGLEWKDLYVDGTANIDALVADTAKISDLTDNHVVVAGSAGELEGSGDLTFDGSTLAVTGALTVSTNATITGNLTVLGTQSILNTETLKVEDSLIEVGLVNSGGSLVPPSSDANIDVGLIMHYYSGSAKKAAVYWDDSVSRVVVGSDVSESTSVMTAAAYAALEVGSLWVKDSVGQSETIGVSGGQRILHNITVDGGSF